MWGLSVEGSFQGFPLFLVPFEECQLPDTSALTNLATNKLAPTVFYDATY